MQSLLDFNFCFTGGELNFYGKTVNGAKLLCHYLFENLHLHFSLLLMIQISGNSPFWL